MIPSENTQRDREMILSPYQWPLFYLPLKRNVKGGFPEIAILRTATGNPDHEFHVHVNMSVYGPLGEVEEKVYKGVDALLEDGWHVD